MSTVAVVTGAAKGIGLAIATRLIADGTHVIAVDRDEQALAHATAAEGDLYEPLLGDVTEWQTHEDAANRAETAGELRYWVNNAGVDWQGAAHEIGVQHIDDGLSVLLAGPMYGAAVAVRRMLPARRGAIVTISSIQGIAAFPHYFVYGAAKAALLGMTRSIATDYAPYGIRCNAVLPGVVDTSMTDASLSGALERDAALQQEGLLAAIGRIGTPQEVAEVVAFLLSDRSSYLTGAEVVVDGGATARCYAYPPLAVDAGGPDADR